MGLDMLRELGEMRLQGGAIGGFDALETAILLLVARPIGDGGAVECLRADRASDNLPCSVFNGLRRARFY
jgi:hypothetical protein